MVRSPRYAPLDSTFDEEASSGGSSCGGSGSTPMRLVRQVAPWAGPMDAVLMALLILGATSVVIWSAIHDLNDATHSDPCDPLKISKHLHCVPSTKPATFANVLEVQGTEREHYSVVEKQRAALRTANRTRHSKAQPLRQPHDSAHTYDSEWVDPAVVS